MAVEAKCPSCGEANPPGASSCKRCGHPLAGRVCPHCGQAGLRSGAVFCKQCGRSLDTPVATGAAGNPESLATAQRESAEAGEQVSTPSIPPGSVEEPADIIAPELSHSPEPMAVETVQKPSLQREGQICPHCGQSGLRPEARFCKYCGRSLESRVEAISRSLVFEKTDEDARLFVEAHGRPREVPTDGRASPEASSHLGTVFPAITEEPLTKSEDITVPGEAGDRRGVPTGTDVGMVGLGGSDGGLGAIPEHRGPSGPAPLTNAARLAPTLDGRLQDDTPAGPEAGVTPPPERGEPTGLKGRKILDRTAVIVLTALLITVAVVLGWLQLGPYIAQFLPTLGRTESVTRPPGEVAEVVEPEGSSVSSETPQSAPGAATTTAASPTPGSLVIVSAPVGAHVEVDGEPVGATPLTLQFDEPGRHRIGVALPDYQAAARKVDVRPGESRTLRITLVSVRKAEQDAIDKAIALYQKDHYGEAARAMQTVVQSNPRSAAAHLWLGRIYAKLGQAERATEAFKTVERLRPGSPEAAAAKAARVGLQGHAPRAPRMLEVGFAAPAFSLKDRVGVIYRLQSARGSRVILLFVWTLDAPTMRLIREFDRRLSTSPANVVPLVVVLEPDRLVIRSFVTAEGIKIPVLFGTRAIAQNYGVPEETPVLYVLTEQGAVAQRQVGTIRLGAVVR